MSVSLVVSLAFSYLLPPSCSLPLALARAILNAQHHARYILCLMRFRVFASLCDVPLVTSARNAMCSVLLRRPSFYFHCFGLAFVLNVL